MSEFPGNGIGLASVDNRGTPRRSGKGRERRRRGATFHFTLDAKEIAMRNKSILLVEDNPDDED